MSSSVIRKARGAIAAAICLWSAATIAADAVPPPRTLLADPPREIGDFELISHEGKPLRLSQLRGAPVVVFFAFTHCPSICPAALQQLRQLETQHAGALGRTRILIISVDGERDSPAAMKDWLARVSTAFIGVTGQPAKVQPIATEFSAAFYKQPGATAQQYLVEHSSQIFLLDGRGRLRATFFNAPVNTMADVIASVAAEGHPKPSQRVRNAALQD